MYSCRSHAPPHFSYAYVLFLFLTASCKVMQPEGVTVDMGSPTIPFTQSDICHITGKSLDHLFASVLIVKL